MHKYVIALGFLPLLGACAATPAQGVKTAEECRIVAQDNTDSHIKVKQECSPVAQGGTADPAGQPQSQRAPQ